MEEFFPVTEDWVRRTCITSNVEIIAAHKMGFVQPDAGVANL